MSKTSFIVQIPVIAIFGWPNQLKLTHMSAHSLLMPKTPLFGQISVIAIFCTQGVIFRRLAESAEVNAHKRS